MNNTKVVLSERPAGYPKAHHFRIEQSPIDSIPVDGVLIKNHFLSIDPAMRGWICDVGNYLDPVAIGSVMRSLAVGEVIESSSDRFSVGDFVTGWFGWQQFAAVPQTAIIRKVSRDEGSLSASLGVLGLNGITAYLTLKLIGKPKEGETVLISTSAGAVGSLAGQLARRQGCYVVGITGSDDKVERCISEFGFHAAINYNSSPDLVSDIRDACPNGVDVYLDNTSGAIADAAVECMNINGRIIQCGTASISSWDPIPQAPRRDRAVLTKRLLQQGFVIFDHMALWPEVIDELSGLLNSGELTVSEDIRQGLTSAPLALEELYLGKNKGKLIVCLE